jgi:predicted kinase
VIVDAAFLRADHRRHFETIARRLGVPFEILHCEVDDAASRERLEARARAATDPSDATVATWARQKRWAEPLSAAERAVTTWITGDAGQVAAIAARWRPPG